MNRYCLTITTALWLLLAAIPGYAATDLADKPLFTSSNVPGNVALALSVEFPTAVGSSYRSGYVVTDTYLGYFDPDKCYEYHIETDVAKHYFEPSVAADAHKCTGKWSGNFLNWALTQTIDPLRSVLTGGYRHIDEVGLTVLEKAWANQSGGGVANPAITDNPTLIAGATPYSFNTIRIRINSLRDKFYFTSTADNNNPGASGGVVADTDIPASPDGTRVYEMYARVRVCVSGKLEANCTKYGSNYKPTGLIQKNALKLNFAAFGYLNDNNINRDGGVLRAKMAQLGPEKSVPGSPNVSNPNAEWDAATGIFTKNPDPVDAAVVGVSNSGVINYLNKFGTLGTYKSFDPVSELYYSVIRYYKNLGNVSAYTKDATATMIDGFPVITDWDDPVKYACQKNFIIGIGDNNTHRDANLPGSTIAGNEPAMPTEVSSDSSVNVRLATNRVGAIQDGTTNLGEITTGCCNQNTFFIAGLAYDSHTKDIRTDFLGKQTVDTYWLDVLESGFRAANRNQYWLTAKFGGFDVSTDFDPYSEVIPTLTTGQWDKNSDGDPDNYFRANNPALMISNLNKAFDSILKNISGSSSKFSFASALISDGDLSYGSNFSVEGWVGDVEASKISGTGTGSTSTSLVWSASEKLQIQAADTGWDTKRFIATAACKVDEADEGTQKCKGVPFRVASLDETSAATLGSSALDQAALLNFLRGDRSKEGTLFRSRTKLLADIVNSAVLPVGKPVAGYSDAFNPGYSSFKSSKASRQTMVYVGANDGMLHAFKGGSSGGTESFAYIPNATFTGPSGAPSDDGLVALAKTSFVHHYYVDASPKIYDVNFGGGSSDWHSLLVSGMGKGGKAYFALDVTNPDSLNTEEKLAAAVKWEFKHKHLGYSYGRPIAVKTAKYGWVIVLTSGYNNDDGKGYFFILRPSDGKLLDMVSTGVGTTSNEAGLTGPTAFVSDFRDFTADAIYAGDLLGNVWRLDVSASAGSYSTPTKIAYVDKPITVPPVVEVDQATLRRFVFVGTGKLLADTDISVVQDNAVYALIDGTNAKPFKSADLPSGVSFPYTKSDLINNTSSILEGVTIAADSKKMGYYVDLGDYRVNVEMRSGAGVILIGANKTGGDLCNPAGVGRLYGFNFGTGKSAISLSGSSSLQPYINTDSFVTQVGLFNYVPEGGSSTAVGGVVVTVNESTQIKINQGNIAGFTQLNWREVPTTD